MSGTPYKTQPGSATAQGHAVHPTVHCWILIFFLLFYFIRSSGDVFSQNFCISEFTWQEKERPIICWLRYLAKEDTLSGN